MAMRSAQKAAVLLSSLDPTMAAELLGSVPPETVTEIVAELALLTHSKKEGGISRAKPIREFFKMFFSSGSRSGKGDFLHEMVKMSLGEERMQEVFSDVDRKVKMRDPFAEICKRGARELSLVLKGESPQVIAIVLAELPSSKSAEILGTLDEEIRPVVVQSMISGQGVLPETRLRVATFVEDGLQQFRKQDEGEVPAGDDADMLRQQQLRKTAILLRSMDVSIREGLIKTLTEQDKEAAQGVLDMMVLWEDVAVVSERQLQEALRSADSRSLALAMTDADEKTTEKIRENISERARAMVDEEMSLLTKPKPEDIQEAREVILEVLRKMNASGELEFEEE